MASIEELRAEKARLEALIGKETLSAYMQVRRDLIDAEISASITLRDIRPGHADIYESVDAIKRQFARSILSTKLAAWYLRKAGGNA